MAKLKSGTRIYGTATIDTSVVVGSAVTLSSSGIQVTGIVTATTFVGALTGTATSTTNIPNLTGAITSNNTTTSLGSFTSAQLATALTDETGSGANVFATSPTLVTPVLGAATATSIVVSSGSTFTNGPILVGSGTSTGTAGQVLQVSGINSSVYIGGSVGIGTTNPTQKLHVQGNVRVAGGLYDFNNGVGSTGQVLQSVGTGISWTTFSGGGGSTITVSDDTSTNATRYLIFEDITSGTSSSINVSSTKLTFNPSTGTLSATVFTSLSDANKKRNIRPIENAIEITKKLEGVRFNWKDTDAPSIGVIAQEVEKVLPELVVESDGVKSVSYGNIVGVLIEAIKEQQVRIEELERKLNA